MYKNAAKVAMIQMLVKTDDLEANINRARKLLGDACHEAKPDFAVFPETADLGWATDRARELAAPAPGGKACEAFQAMAEKYGVYVVAGITERDGDSVYNTAVFISPEGALLAKHRKINVLQDVEGMYEIGDRLNVVHTPFGRIGFDICADNFSSSTTLLHSMARMGARMVLSPSAWAVPPGFDNEKTPYGGEWAKPYSELSRMYRMPVFGVSNVGKMDSGAWAGHSAIGNSMAYDADGEQLAVLPFGVDAETVRVVDVALSGPIARGTGFSGVI